MASDAVGLERVSKVTGYKIKKGNFNESSPNLPQRIAIFAEANNANQGTLDTSATQITSAKQAGELYGFGSPVYHIMRILRPLNSGGIGGVPTYVYAQEEASGAAAKIIDVTPSGTATGNGTHYLKIAGRDNVDGQYYAINIVSGDTVAEITAKMYNAVNNVIGSPVIADDYTYETRFTTKWNGLTADDVTITVDTNDIDLGVTYTVETIQNGSGTPSISAALAAFGNDWNTLVINSYGVHNATMATLEAFNGIPDPENPTGRYTGTIVKPFIALTGSVADDPSADTDSRPEDVTIAICPAPLSPGLSMEAAANVCLLLGRQAQDNPHLDISGRSYPDMPIPTDGNIGSMATYDNRDTIVKKGCSTVELVAGRYKVADLVTSYHPDGELPPQFRYVRNLIIDWNVYFGYYLLEQIHVVDHAIAANTDTVTASNVIKPKQWVQIVSKYAEDLTSRGLIVDTAFMQDSIIVNISTTNPDRLETQFNYKRSGFARIAATTATAGFNFGTNT